MIHPGGDVLAEWKKSRFVIAPSELIDQPGVLVILTDYKFWTDRYEQLQSWCKENNCDTQGMTVTMPNDAALTAFCLRWS